MNQQNVTRRSGRRAASSLLQTESTRPAGNLSLAQRREFTIKRAVPLFLEKGYDNVSMNDIIDAAGGSKATVYALFGNKEGLFEEIVRWMAAETSVSVDLATMTGPIDVQLQKMGMAFLQTVLDPTVIELHRLMVSMGRTFPAATSSFYRAGPANAYHLFADWLREQQSAGKIRPGDPEDLSALFLDMVLGEFQLGILTGTREAPKQQEMEARVEIAVEIFLGGSAVT